MKHLLYIIYLAPLLSFSSVWKSQHGWDDKKINWESKFSEWVQSEELKKDIFVDPESPYTGLAVDCADVMYLLRAIFAFENKLSFQVVHPLYAWRTNRKYFTHNNSSWDYLPREERFIEFLKYLADNFGTESLAHYDSYSIAPESISPGDFFMFEKQLDPEKDLITRHAFLLKNITKTGLFDILYSTQTARDNGKPMYYKKNHQFSAALAPEKKKWGFKRFKKPSDYYRRKRDIPFYDNIQYKIVEENDGAFFFSYVQSKLEKEKEDPEMKVVRLFNDLCIRSKNRVEAVNDALAYKEKIKDRCMNNSEYDIYSTPLRDSRIKGAFNTAKYFIEEIKDITLESPFQVFLENVFKENLDLIDLDNLTDQCTIHYSADESFNLNDIYKNISKKMFSSNPNDDLAARWGLEPSNTNCN